MTTLTKGKRKELGEYIRMMRESVGWSVGKLAFEVGVLESTIRNAEEGAGRVEDREKLAAAVRKAVAVEQKLRRDDSA